MTIDKVFCFFEQSGTFKNEFIRLGIPAEDYDIQNHYGQTDHVTDLFAEIDKAYEGGRSVFDRIGRDDLVMAFFPCIYFEAMQQTYFALASVNYRAKSKEETYRTLFERIENRHRFYKTLYRLYAVCDLRGLRLVIENPATEPNYLMPQNFPKPTVIDRDRTRRGDVFRKPTAYWFLNISPPAEVNVSRSRPERTGTIKGTRWSGTAGVCGRERSEITPEYARNFICDFILGKRQENTELSLFHERLLQQLGGAILKDHKNHSLFCEHKDNGITFAKHKQHNMIVAFDKEYLQQLYMDGKSDKKHRFQPDIIRRYQTTVNRLMAAPDVNVLRSINSLNYEILKGDKEGISSVRVNKRYRMEFTVDMIGTEQIITVCNILELSNHYK